MFNKSRQAFYQHIKRGYYKSYLDFTILSIINKYRAFMPRIGTRKLQYCLYAHQGIKYGRDRLFDLLRTHGLLVKRRRNYCRTTNSNHPFKKYPDLLTNSVVNHAEEFFVSDITYIRTVKGFYYLHLVSDAYSKRIMGHCFSKDLGTSNSIKGLKMSLFSKQYNKSITHHSDRGLQYCSNDYIKILTENNVRISMTESGDPRDNAVAERINGILKHELGLKRTFKSFEEANDAVFKAISIYNYIRPHLSCGYLTPDEAHKKGKNLKKCWKSYPASRINQVLVEN